MQENLTSTITHCKYSLETFLSYCLLPLKAGTILPKTLLAPTLAY